jgi:hypothetical protein
MIRAGKFLFAASLPVLGAGLMYTTLRSWDVRKLTAEVAELEVQREQLRTFITRLKATRRVAQADVLQQYLDEQGRPVNVIRWNQIGLDGTLEEPQTIEAVGRLVYFEAAIIKFDQDAVGQGDPEKGATLAMFRRIFGEDQAASSTGNLEQRSTPPSPDGRPAAEFEQKLWDLFWKMMDDPDLQDQFGVRVTQIEAPAALLKAGQVWEVSLDAAGGLNLRIIAKRSVAPSTSPVSDS